MVDNDKDRMNPKADSSQRPGNPSAASSSSQNLSGSGSGTSSTSGQQGNSSKMGAEVASVAEDLKQQAKGVASQATEKGKATLNQQKDTVAQQVDSVSGVIRNAADQLRQDGQSQTGYYVSMLAEQLETFGQQLRSKDANALIRDAENLSRRSPLVFFAGAIAAGFVAARFLKSSSRRSSYEDSDSYGAFGRKGSSQDDTSYSWRNEMGEGERDENIGQNRTMPLDTEGGGSMADSAASGTLGGQWGAGTTVAGPEVTGIYRPSQASTANKSSTPGTELPGSAQPSVSADGKPQPGRPTDAIGGSTKSSSPTDQKPGGNIYGNR